MPLNTIPLPYGLRDVRLTPYTTAAADTLGTGVDLPYARTFSFTDAEDYDDLRGDDKVIATHGKGSTIEWDLEAGGISLEAYKVLAGGSVGTTGTTPNQIKTYSKLVTDARGWFKAEGQAISDSGGDTHCVVYKCKTTGNIEGSFGDGEFYLTKAKGKAIASTLSGKIDYLYEFIQNETTTAIP